MKKLVVLGAGAIAVASAALLSPAQAQADPVSANSVNVVGEPYGQALRILKSQNVKAFFGGSHGSDLPQSQCIVAQQKLTSGGRMYLNLDCTEAAAADAAGSAPAAGGGPAAGGPAPGAGQGTYGGPIGVPVPVG